MAIIRGVPDELVYGGAAVLVGGWLLGQMSPLNVGKQAAEFVYEGTKRAVSDATDAAVHSGPVNYSLLLNPFSSSLYQSVYNAAGYKLVLGATESGGSRVEGLYWK